MTHRVFDELIKEDLRRREVRSLSEFLPLVGLGILADNQLTHLMKSGNSAEGDEGGGLAFYQAAARYMQRHHPDLDWLTEGFQPTERQGVEDFIEALHRTSLPESQEDSDWESRRAKFMNGVLHFEANSDEKRLADFLDYQKLINSADETRINADNVTLMTLHAAKGTEFPIVIIIGMDEGTFPIRRKDQSLSEIEEERRLFYVGMTRAQERLYLTSVARRYSDHERASSMFIREIPSNLMKRWSPRTKRFRHINTNYRP